LKSIVLNGVQTWSFVSRRQLVDFALESKKMLVAINAEKILHATDETRRLINENIGYSDGIGAVWALRRKGLKDVVKIPGCELWLDIIRSAYRNKTFYLVGSKQEILEATVSKLRTEFPGIQIVNYHNGYIRSEEEKSNIIDDIILQKPDIVFVGMGSPRQELLMEEMQKCHSAVYQGLGGSFDVYTGYVKRAPYWWVKNNLEWAYRLVRQPIRIKRQVFLLKFFILLLLNKL
jgi:UDP-N-acetyl-D-mannosaminouronate:lipid I N-acetyl-D-mannosaminouronosyltransferase